MIPFALLQGELVFYDSKRLEVQIHELSEKHILIRVPSGYLKTSGLIKSIELFFYIHDKKKYEKTVISSDSFSLKKVTEDKYSDWFEIKIRNEYFSEYSRMLSKKYLEYIDLKLFEEDCVMSHVMTEGRYPDNKENVMKTDPEENEIMWMRSLNEKAKDIVKGRKLYYSLEAPLKMKGFLKNKTECIPDELRKNFVFDGVVIGNSFCTNLFPDFEQFVSLAGKAFSCGMMIMVTVPPVPESETDKFCILLSKMTEYLKTQKTESCVFQFGDEGMLSFAYDNLSDDDHCFFEKGILLHKNKRDPRRRYLEDDKDVCGHGLKNLMFSDKTVFGPYFQTNTGTFCPLHALITKGSRGRQTRVSECEKYCENYYLHYPDHLMMKGEGNSLFGIDSTFLNDAKITELTEWETCERIVINI